MASLISRYSAFMLLTITLYPNILNANSLDCESEVYGLEVTRKSDQLRDVNMKVSEDCVTHNDLFSLTLNIGPSYVIKTEAGFFDRSLNGTTDSLRIRANIQNSIMESTLRLSVKDGYVIDINKSYTTYGFPDASTDQLAYVSLDEGNKWTFQCTRKFFCQFTGVIEEAVLVYSLSGKYPDNFDPTAISTSVEKFIRERLLIGY